MAGAIMALRKCVCANRRATRREKERGGFRGRERVRVCKRVLILVHVIFSNSRTQSEQENPFLCFAVTA